MFVQTGTERWEGSENEEDQMSNLSSTQWAIEHWVKDAKEDKTSEFTSYAILTMSREIARLESEAAAARILHEAEIAELKEHTRKHVFPAEIPEPGKYLVNSYDRLIVSQYRRGNWWLSDDEGYDYVIEVSAWYHLPRE